MNPDANHSFASGFWVNPGKPNYNIQILEKKIVINNNDNNDNKYNNCKNSNDTCESEY